MSEISFPLQYKRQYAASLDIDLVFDTIANKTAYLTNARRYAGMVVTCLEQEGKIFILNNAKTAWNEIQMDVDKSYVDASLGARDISIAYLSNNKVDRAGDTITGSLIIDGSLNIKGHFTVDGSVTFINTGTLNVSDNIITLNYGLTGIPPDTLQSGIKINRGDAEPYVFLFDEHRDEFRIGISIETSSGFNDSSTQAVATRQDTPVSNGLAYYNSSMYRFDTSTLTINDLYNKSYIDTSLGLRDTSINNVNTYAIDLSTRVSNYALTPIITTIERYDTVDIKDTLVYKLIYTYTTGKYLEQRCDYDTSGRMSLLQSRDDIKGTFLQYVFTWTDNLLNVPTVTNISAFTI